MRLTTWCWYAEGSPAARLFKDILQLRDAGSDQLLPLISSMTRPAGPRCCFMDSVNRVTLEPLEKAALSGRASPSKPDIGVVKATEEPQGIDIHSYFPLRWGPSEKALLVAYRDQQLISSESGLMLKVSNGEYYVGNVVNFVADTDDSSGGTGSSRCRSRLWHINDDSTISPVDAQHFVLGSTNADLLKNIIMGQTFLSFFISDVSTFGICSFLSMPGTLWLGRQGYFAPAYAFIAVKFMFSAVGQCFLRKSLERWIQAQTHPGMAKLQEYFGK